MQENKLFTTQSISIGILAVIVIAGGIFLFKKTNSPSPVFTENMGTTTQTFDNTATTKINGNGYTIEQVPVTESKTPAMPLPDLNRPLTVYAGYPVAPEAKTMSETKVTNLQSELKKDSRNWSNWIDLGIYQKQGGDFEGAILSWKYAHYLSPTDYVSLGNLASLYAYFLKDNAQAEVYYKKAIVNGPNQPYLYIQLSEVYRDIFKDIDRAKAIIEEGLLLIPNDPTLTDFKKNLK